MPQEGQLQAQDVGGVHPVLCGAAGKLQRQSNDTTSVQLLSELQIKVGGVVAEWPVQPERPYLVDPLLGQAHGLIRAAGLSCNSVGHS